MITQNQNFGFKNSFLNALIRVPKLRPSKDQVKTNTRSMTMYKVISTTEQMRFVVVITMHDTQRHIPTKLVAKCHKNVTLCRCS
jgi:hypothetical protein